MSRDSKIATSTNNEFATYIQRVVLKKLLLLTITCNIISDHCAYALPTHESVNFKQYVDF